MGFADLSKVEKKILKVVRLRYLRNKYYGGKTLEERTKIGDDFGLNTFCDGKFKRELAGRHYCFNMFGDVDCPYRLRDLSEQSNLCKKVYANAISWFEMIKEGKDGYVFKERVYTH